jgi:hypothetical protein
VDSALHHGHLEGNESVDRSQRLIGVSLLAVRESLRSLLRMPGRKALVLFAEGLHFATAVPGEIPPQSLDLWPMTELANRASTVVYTVDPRGVGAGLSGIPDPQQAANPDAQIAAARRGPGSQLPLVDLAHDTGGLFLPTNDMSASLRRVAEDQRGYYLLGYEPEASVFETGALGARFHRVSVRAKRPGLQVRTRAGFYGVADRPWSPPAPVGPLRTALESPFTSEQLGLHITALPDADNDRRPVVRVLLHVDGGDLRLAEREGGGREASLEALVAAWNGAGEPVGETASRFSVPVAAAEEARLRGEGFVYAATLAVPGDGAYQVRAAVRDAGNGRIGSAAAVADVPDFRRRDLVLSGLLLSSGGASVPDAGSGLLPEVTPGVRVFPRDSSLRYTLRALGARPDRSTVRPRLAVVTRLLHDGQAIFTSPETRVVVPAGESATTVRVSGVLPLPGGLESGSYVLQVLVHDLLAPTAGGRTTQSIDLDLR